MRNCTRPMLYRIKSIHDMISAGRYPNFRDFHERFEVSRSTILRDLGILKVDFHAPIVFDGRNQGYCYSEPYELPFNSLDKDSSGILLRAMKALEAYKGTPFYDDLSESLGSMVSDDARKAGSSILDRIESVGSRPCCAAGRTRWALVFEALERNLVIEFDYGQEGSKAHETVEPYQVVLDNGMAYLFANRAESGITGLFAIHELENLRITGRSFSLPPVYRYSELCQGATSLKVS